MTKIKTNLTVLFLLIVVALCFSSCNMKDRDIENGIVFNTYGENFIVRDITYGAGEHVVIPSEHSGKPVTILSDLKSYYLDSYGRYETLILPESIERIGDDFYYNASSKLKYNEYGNGLYLGTAANPYMVLIELDITSVEDFKLNKDTKIIAANAFAKCTLLEDISFEGTEADWNAIIKSASWNGDLTINVTCSDKMITILG